MDVPTLDELMIHWQWALDAGGRALAAAASELPDGALERHRGALADERARTAALLDGVAREEHAHVHAWLAPSSVTPRLLGLPDGTEACIFDVDGVLADSGVLHARAWAQVLDDILLRRATEAGWQFVPFDPVGDYRTYIDGRPRLDGVHGFLASRGITLPTGKPADVPGAETIYGVAASKGLALDHTIHRTGVVALPTAQTYLLAAGFAHVHRAVVSTSATTAHVLEHADLAPLVEVQIDGAFAAAAGLRARPAPDMLLAACERLGVLPERAVSLTRSAAGIAAAEAAGMRAIGIAHGRQAERLAHFGATRIVPSLAALLDPQLRASAY
jgi:beta-phosphoglucomutase-like phosphatase (HAD superfamily)